MKQFILRLINSFIIKRCCLKVILTPLGNSFYCIYSKVTWFSLQNYLFTYLLLFEYVPLIHLLIVVIFLILFHPLILDLQFLQRLYY